MKGKKIWSSQLMYRILENPTTFHNKNTQKTRNKKKLRQQNEEIYIYIKNPTANTIYGQWKTESFSSKIMKKKGWPLLPFLFTTVLEILAREVRPKKKKKKKKKKK